MRYFARLGFVVTFATLAVAALGACSEEPEEQLPIPSSGEVKVSPLNVTIDEDQAATISFLSSTTIPANTFAALVNATIDGERVFPDSTGKLSFTPPRDFNGILPLTFEVVSGGRTRKGTGTLTVRPVQDPVLAVSTTQTLNEDGELSFELEARDVDGDPLTFTIEQPPLLGTLTGSGAHWVYRPMPNANGSDSVFFSVSDGATSSTGILSISVLPVNDVPVATPASIELAEDAFFDLTFEGSDVDGGSLTYALAVAPQHGTVSGFGAQRRYVPAANYHGPDDFSFVVTDGQLTSNLAKVTINVTSVDDPTTALPVTVSATEDLSAALTLRGGDGDGTPLVYAVGTPAHGTLSGTAPALTYTPARDYNGSDSFSYTVTADGPPATATVTVNIAAVNDAPVVSDGSATTAEDTPVAIQLQASDVDSPSLTYSMTVPAQDGTVSGSGANLTYRPAANLNGTRTFAFTASDGARASSGTITVTITPVNDAPVARGDYVATDANEPLDIAALTNDVDLEDDALSLESITSPQHGTAVIEDGVIAYTPDADFTGEDLLSYTVADSAGATATGTIRVGVETFPAGAPQETLALSVPGTASDALRRPSISYDGRFIAFATTRSLVASDTNGVSDVYVYDRGKRLLQRASVRADGSSANGAASEPQLSGNGRYVVFVSISNNLVPGDSNAAYDVFRRDLRSGEVLRISVNSQGVEGNAASQAPRISDDGNLIVFTSSAFNLASGDTNGASDVFLRDVAAGTTSRVSVSLLGGNVDLASTQPAISGDGKVVAFSSEGTNLVAGDNNAVSDVFVRNLQTNVTQRISVSTNGVEGNGSSSRPSLSRDGQFVSFASLSSNLVPGVDSGTFVRDVVSQTTSLGYVFTGAGNQLSGDGRYLTLHTSTTAYLVDRFAGASSTLFPPSGSRWDWPVLSGNGKYIVLIENPSGAILVLPNPR